MDLIDVQIEENGTIFKVQKRMSFIQQNEMMELLEDFIDLAQLQRVKDKKGEDVELTMVDFKEILNEGVKFSSFSFGLTKFCLMNFVREPEITEEKLADPDDPNSENFAILGAKMVEIAFEIIGERTLLKKTPMK